MKSCNTIMNNNGSIEIIIGCMFSGKTTQLINTIRRYQSIGKQIMVINYKDDTRYGDNQIISHDKMGIDSINIEHLIELKNSWSEQYQKCSIICINEAQFFKNLKRYCLEFCNLDHKKVILCGLDGDYKQEPFGELLELIPHSEKITRLHAMCKVCNNGNKAFFTKRTTSSKEKILIGGENEYVPVCRFHLYNDIKKKYEENY